MTIFLLIFFILLLLYSFLIEFYRRSWNNIPESDRAEDQQAAMELTPVFVSLIIPLRNEEHNVKGLLQCISIQDYPQSNMEVILVDDHSTDATWPLLQNATMDQPSLSCLQLPYHLSGKKKAIEAGIHAAKGELIVTTDGDCIFPPSWINAIADFYRSTNAKLIAGPVRMKPANSFLGTFQALDFLTLQGITGASVYKKFHPMCNGANLAYTRQAFNEVNGFEGIDDIPSGDDMLLMHKIFSRYPKSVYYLKNKSAIVETQSEPSFRHFLNQRIRWASKAVHYNDKKIFYVLLLAYLVNIGFMIFAVAAIINSYWLWFLVLLLLMKILIEFPFVNSVSIFSDSKS